MNGQRFDIETGIQPPMKKVITLTHPSGVIIYVAIGAFGPTVSEADLRMVAIQVSAALATHEDL